MRFQVLGPLEVEADDGPVVLGGPKERLLLALLLTRPDRVVSVEALVRGLWGEHPPNTAAKTLQSHVKRLRRALEPDRTRGAAGEVLVTRQPGYLLRVAPGALDATRFEELTAKARRALDSGAADTAAALLRQALGLWQGQAFQEFLDSDVVVAEADRLGELRLVALEDRIEADLQLGRHRELVAELEGLVRDQPLRERLWAQLLLALYRSGRQADALLAYQRARSVLVEELGIDPGAELRRLHAAVLAQDPGLDLPAAEAAGARELPDPLKVAGPPFVGRAAELAWLRAAWTRAAQGEGGIVLVAGRRGMGKTRLAAELAREVHQQGGRVLYGRCSPGPNDPLQPFTQALAHWGGAGANVPDMQRSPAAFGKGLVGLLPSRSDAAVLLVLDDLQLAQPPALEALAALVAATAKHRLLVLGTYCQEKVSPALDALVERLGPDAITPGRLGPFNEDEVAQVLGLYESEQAARAAARLVLDATGGVPLLVHQTAGTRAQAQAAHQVKQTASQTASSRGHLQTVQAKLADDVVDLREHSEQVTRLAAAQGQPDEEPEDRPAAAVCPYKGLARFEPSDAAYFFGRERLVAELVTHLVGAGLVGVVGPSGSGKSSLVRAGLLPALADGALPGSDRWRQVLLRPGEHPMAELGLALGASDSISASTADAYSGAATRGDSEAGGPVLGRTGGKVILEAAAGAPTRLLLVVDQFEEAFTTCQDEAERARFLAALAEAARADRNVTVVVAVRADYYGHCAADPALAGLLAANHVLVGPMGADELRRAVELPARRVQLRLEPGLADAMIGEVAEEPGGLPLLSCALLESWQHRQGRTLTLAAYQQAGGVRGAVARLAERAWRQLDPGQQQAARRILLRLAGPGEGEAVVRRRVPLAEFTAGGDEHARVVLDALADQRLLTMGEDSVEVAHEALLREWPRLRGWLEEDVQGRALHRHLIGAAREWDQSGRDPGELYRGARLTGALDWARDHHADLNELEREFLAASRAVAEREVADARRRAEREARTSRRLRGLVAGLAGVLALALVAGGFALALRGRAREQAQIATARELASSAISVLDQDPELTILLAIEAIKAAPGEDLPPRLVSALHQAVRSMRALRSLPFQELDGVMSPDASLIAVTGGKDTLQARHSATGNLAWTIKDDVGAGWFSGPQFSPDGSVLAVAFNRYWTKEHRVKGGRAAGIYLIEPKSGNIIDVIPPPSKCGWVGLPSRYAFTPDGAHLLRVIDPPPCRDGALRLEFVDLDRGNVTRRVPVTSSPQGENDEPLLFAGVDSRHGRLYVSDGEGTFGLSAASTRMIDLASGKVLWEREEVNGFLSPDGSIMALTAAAPTQRAVELVDPATGETLRSLTGHKAGTADVAFSDDGRLAYTAGLDGTARVWDTATGSNLITLRGERAGFLGLSVDDKGDRLATFGRHGSVRIWDLTMKPLGETMALDLSPWQTATRAIDAAGGVAAVNAFSDQEGALFVFDPATGEIIRRIPDQASQFLALTPDGRAIVYQHLVHYGPDIPDSDWVVGPIVVRDVFTGAARTEFEGLCSFRVGAGDVLPWKDCPAPPDHPYAESPLGMSVTPDGRRAVAGGESFAVSVWDLHTGSVVATVPFGEPGSGFVTNPAIHPDGSKVAVGISDDKQPRVTIVGLDRSVLAEFPLDKPAVGAGHIAFSPDGSLLAAGGAQLKVFDTKGWTLLWQVDAHDGGVFHLDVSPDSRSIVTTGTDGFVRLWDARDGSLLQAISMGEDYGKAVAFTDNRHVVVGTVNGLVAGLTFDIDELVRIGRSRVTRSLTDQECRTYLHLDRCL